MQKAAAAKARADDMERRAADFKDAWEAAQGRLRRDQEALDERRRAMLMEDEEALRKNVTDQ